MRLAIVCVILVCVGSVINALRQGATFALPQCLPACGGSGRPLEFELGSAAMLGLCGWGILRFFGPRRDADE